MTIAVRTIIDRAKFILQDDTSIRWTEEELVMWINSAQLEIVLLRPDAYSEVVSHVVDTSRASQEIAEALQILDVLTANDGLPDDGGLGAPTNVVRRVERAVLDAMDLNWVKDDASPTQHYVLDDRNRKTFYLYPHGSEYVSVLISKAPADVSDAADSLLDPIFAGPILDYVLYRAYSKDAEFAANAERATAYYTSFNTSIGLNTAAQRAAVKVEA